MTKGSDRSIVIAIEYRHISNGRHLHSISFLISAVVFEHSSLVVEHLSSHTVLHRSHHPIIMAVRVVTYNLLVPKLAEEPGYFSQSRPEYISIQYRWRLIQRQLAKEIQTHPNTIICLQEVSRGLLRELQTFFHRMHYTFFESRYGNEHNDFMGVGIAIPAAMKLLSKDFITIGDHLRSTIDYLAKKGSLSAAVARRHGQGAIPSRYDKVAKNVWDLAIEKRNRLICLQVVVDGRPLFIGTYHMPCLFDKPAVMMIHALAVKDLMYQLSNGHPFILAGDFNARPTEIAYRVITEPTVAERALLPNIPDTDVSYPFDRRHVLRSAYRTVNGAEPNFTNFSTTTSARDFMATLDYIFYAGHLAVTDVLPLPAHPTGRSYPDRDHPSDHLMLAATFRIPSR